MDSPDSFNKLVEEIRDKLQKTPPLTNADWAANYELAGAADLIKQYQRAHENRLLVEAIRRFERLFERSDKFHREWARSKLPELLTIGREIASGDPLPREEGRTIAAPSGEGPKRLDQRKREWDLLVITALLDPELSALLNCLEDVQDNIGLDVDLIRGITYYTGTLGTPRGTHRKPLSVVAVFQSRVGMVDCAAIVASSILQFRPRIIAMTGVGAGRSRMGVKINDLLIPRSAFTCDTGKYTEATFEREPLWIDVADVTIQRVRSVGPRLLAEIARKLNLGGVEPRVTPPVIHTDVMATGSAVVDRGGMIDEIAGHNRKVVGVDMEAYGFLRAAKLVDPTLKAFVVKGVMDLGSEKTDQEKERAAFWAATFLCAFVTSEFDNLCPD